MPLYPNEGLFDRPRQTLVSSMQPNLQLRFHSSICLVNKVAPPNSLPRAP
jgi:hypothetical protein